MKTYLIVKYKDKNKVKALGAKWDLARNSWYIENVENISSFLPWISSKLKKPTTSEPLKHPKFKRPKKAKF